MEYTYLESVLRTLELKHEFEGLACAHKLAGHTDSATTLETLAGEFDRKWPELVTAGSRAFCAADPDTQERLTHTSDQVRSDRSVRDTRSTLTGGMTNRGFPVNEGLIARIEAVHDKISVPMDPATKFEFDDWLQSSLGPHLSVIEEGEEAARQFQYPARLWAAQQDGAERSEAVTHGKVQSENDNSTGPGSESLMEATTSTDAANGTEK